jgi:C-terminal processing protease CtpA/Prc
VANAALPTNYPRPEECALIRVEYAALFPAGARVALTVRSSGGAPRTVTLTAVPLPTTSGGWSASTQAPIRMATMDGFGYAQWSEFSRPHATLALWEAFIRRMIAARMPGIILDLRDNRGGSGTLGGLMASYLFTRSNGYLDRTIVSGYDPAARRMVTFPQSRQPLYALAPDLAYTGKVVVLVSQSCLSECEFFTYTLKHSGRAAVVGQYATGGAGGSVNSLRLPGGITFTYTQSRAVDAHGVPIVEARGVAPTMRVPVTIETVQAQAQGRDPVLDAALAYLHRAR